MTDLSTSIDIQRLRASVYRLASEPRPVGSPARLGAAEFIERELRSYGYLVRRQHLSAAGFPSFNIVAEPPVPQEDETERLDLPIFLLGAHYDSVSGSPGADDNATAVAALLEVARVLAPDLISGAKTRCRLWLVAFDLEEHGMVGSMNLAESLQAAREPVAGMVSLKMLGYTDSRPNSQHMPESLRGLYPSVGNFIGLVGNERSKDLLGHFSLHMKQVPGLPVESLAVPGDGDILPETRLSDHSPFWGLGYSALMITDTSFMRNPHYHLASDTPETIDYEFLTKVTAGVALATQALL